MTEEEKEEVMRNNERVSREFLDVLQQEMLQVDQFVTRERAILGNRNREVRGASVGSL